MLADIVLCASMFDSLSAKVIKRFQTQKDNCEHINMFTRHDYTNYLYIPS